LKFVISILNIYGLTWYFISLESLFGEHLDRGFDRYDEYGITEPGFDDFVEPAGPLFKILEEHTQKADDSDLTSEERGFHENISLDRHGVILNFKMMKKFFKAVVVANYAKNVVL
jgi:hypothetical protein